MSDSSSDDRQAVEFGGMTRWARAVVLGVVCTLVIGVYAWCAKSGALELAAASAGDTYYNLLVQGFRAGQLNLKTGVPAGLAQLADPYDPAANAPYRLAEQNPLGEMSYYEGKLYLYYGVTPTLLLFWPWHELTGHYLLHRDAVVFFFFVGFLAGVGLLWAVWRRYFPEVRFAVVAAGALALGLINFTPAILQRCDVYEVAISCGYALTMLALAAVWSAVHQPARRKLWLAAASLAYGLAVGARPSLLFGAVILLFPVVPAWRQRQRVWPLLIAAVGPLVLIGLGLMLYNYLRFDHPLEFGQRYQLSSDRQSAIQQFGLHYLGFNFRICFLEPARWSVRFPFVHDIAVLPLPAGGIVEQPFGVLTNIPLVWLALAAPLAWRCRSAEARSTLRGFVAAVTLLFGTCALVLCLHNSMCLRYEVEFASTLVLLAVIGIFGLERTLARHPLGLRAARWVWGLTLAFSVAFNLLATFEPQAAAAYNLGTRALQKGQVDEAIAHFQRALEVNPGHAEAHNNLGNALLAKGQVDGAIAHFQKAVELQPGYATACVNLGNALLAKGQEDEAITHLQQALRIMPTNAWAHYNLGAALLRTSQVDGAITHLRRAIELQPDMAEAHINLGNLLFLKGQGQEAVAHFQKALEQRPDHAEAHNNLGYVLQRMGRVDSAIIHYQKALEIRSDYVEARNNLARLLATCEQGAVRNGARAVELAEGANQLAGRKDPAILDTLAAAYAEAGRFDEAVRTVQKAIELAQAGGRVEQARQMQERLQLYQSGRPYHEASTPAP